MFKKLTNKKIWMYNIVSLAVIFLLFFTLIPESKDETMLTIMLPEASAAELEIDESCIVEAPMIVMASRNVKTPEEIEQEELEAYYVEIADEIIGRDENAILTYNPFIESNLSVEQYNEILEGTGLEGLGESYYKMEEEYNVNGLFALSVACLESGYGEHKANKNNYYGMRSSKGWMSFESPDANIQYFGKLMNKSLYHGKNIFEIASVYCPGTAQHWAGSVKSIMRVNFQKITNE